MDVIKDGELHFWIGALLFLFIAFDQTLCLLVTPSLSVFNVPGTDRVGQMNNSIKSGFYACSISFFGVVASFPDSSIYSVVLQLSLYTVLLSYT